MSTIKFRVDDWKGLKIDGNRSQPHIYLFRHAQTYYNRNKYFTGWKDSELTPFGREQAKKVAKKLKGKKIDVAFRTTLSRSRDTLKAVLKYHPECKYVFTDDRMRERSYGKLAGSSHKKYKEKYGEEGLMKIRRTYSAIPPGGESIQMVEKRVDAYLKDLLKFIRRNRVNVAISAHGNSMRPFRRHFEKLTIEQMVKLENPWDDYFEYRV